MNPDYLVPVSPQSLLSADCRHQRQQSPGRELQIIETIQESIISGHHQHLTIDCDNMASAGNPLGNFILTPHQQRLLFEALNANKPTSSPTPNAHQRALSSFDGSPVQDAHGLPGFQDSPLLDFDYELGPADSSFDLSVDDITNSKMIGDLPGGSSTVKTDSTEADTQEKRGHPDDDEENGAKRRESEDKVAKKPGRKPLTTEPSSVSVPRPPQALRSMYIYTDSRRNRNARLRTGLPNVLSANVKKST